MHVTKCPQLSKNHVLQFLLISTNKTKQKKILHTLVDIAKETACEEIQRKETLLELELLKVLVSLNKRSDFWKYLSTLYT